MNQLIVPPKFCVQCGVSIAATDNFCRSCGVSLADGLTVPPANPGQVQDRSNQALQPAGLHPIQKCLNNRLAVVGLIAVVGPIGLPALWFSRRFSKTTKITTTVIYFLVTALLPLLVVWYVFEISLRPLVDAFADR